MGGSISRSCPEGNPSSGPYAVRNIPCALEKYACFKCHDGSLDLTYHPFLTADGNLKTDVVNRNFFQRIGVPLWWWKVLLMVGGSIGLALLQDQGFVPKPFGNQFFSLISAIIFGAYFFVRFSFLISRVNNAAQAFYDLEDGAVSFAQYTNSLLTESDLQRFNDIEVTLTRYDVRNCTTFKRQVSAAEAYCSLAYLTAALGTATINAFREGGVIIEKLPISDEDKMELAYRVGVVNPDYLGVMFQMMTERAEALEDQGLYGASKHRELTGQINGLNGTAVTIAKIESIAPGALVNQFVMIFLYIYLLFVVWVFEYEWWVNVIFAGFFQIIVIGVLDLSEAEGLPFDNVETNPYSSVNVQDRKHTLAIAALCASLSLFGRLGAENIAPPVKVAGPAPTSSSLVMAPRQSTQIPPDYQTSFYQ